MAIKLDEYYDELEEGESVFGQHSDDELNNIAKSIEEDTNKRLSLNELREIESIALLTSDILYGGRLIQF